MRPSAYFSLASKNVFLICVAVLSLSALNSCAQPRYALGGGFPGRPAPAPFYGGNPYCAPQRAFIPRGQVIVPPPVVIVPRRQFAPRAWGWGGKHGWRGRRGW